MGAAALDLAYVAAGRTDAFFQIGLKPWDMAAATVIVREAGGFVADVAGGDRFMETGNLVAANPTLFRQVDEDPAGGAPAQRGRGAGTRLVWRCRCRIRVDVETRTRTDYFESSFCGTLE